jgi:hypothetical protein
MKTKILLTAAMLSVASAVGCHSDKPHEYGTRRPPIDRIDPRDGGLQSADVVDSSERMAMSLLASIPPSQDGKRISVVVTGTENLTVSERRSLDVFVTRVKGIIGQQGRSRIQLIENRDKFRELQSRELEGERDDFGQGGQPSGPGPKGIQPDFALHAVARDLNNNKTTYFQFDFALTDLRTREIVWNDMYEVNVAN